MRNTEVNERGEGGSTLVEVLIAMIVLSMSALAILGLLGTSIAASAEHHSISETNTLLEDFAESVTYQIELAPANSTASPPTPYFVDCPTPSSSATNYLLNYYSHTVQLGVLSSYPAGYSVAITAVAPWNNSLNAFSTSGCPTSGANTDAQGLQQLTLTATGPDQTQETMSIVVSNPTFSAGYESF